MPKISALTSAANLSGLELVPIAQSGATVKTTVEQLRGGSLDPIDPYNLAQYNGVTDCTAALQAVIDECFGTADVPHAVDNAHLNKPFILPPGKFNITAPLTLTKVRGGIIKGAGRFATNIIHTAGGSIFVTNGFEYSHVEGINLSGTSAAVIFDLSWDGSSGPALQSNTFADMFFQNGAFGIAIGSGGFMGSENLFLNCFWGGQTQAGLSTWNFNALQNTVIGGNFQSCGKGIWVGSGSIPNIMGVGFQANSQDIQIDNTTNDTYIVSACRTESANFLLNPNGATIILLGCVQLSATAGVFASCNGRICMDGCYSLNGRISSNQYANWQLRNNDFQRSDFITPGTASIVIDGNPQITYNTPSSFTLGWEFRASNVVEVPSSSPVTITIPPHSDIALPVSVQHSICQVGSGQVTITAGAGVTIHTPRSLTTRAQWSTIYLRQRAIDEWVLSGDLT